MREAWSSHEIWLYECQYCANVWEEAFDVLHADGGHGHEAIVYRHDGHLCPTPWSTHECPECRSENVFATPYRRRPSVPRSRRDSDLELLSRLRRLNAW
ncbi:hypothetical protein [Actinomadura flavalba]|uniref:hypothetical protein n=1 Tax=Actinomadura flavalba TaxID=1120938 RepID=UPI00039B85FD|nr:hypothetical protein [Actinomadura flavalba]